MGARDTILERWVSGVIPKAVAYARSLLRSPQDAEDVIHDVICRLLSHPEYDLETDGEKLLFRGITNACINRWKRRRKILSLDFRMEDSDAMVNTLPAEATPDPLEAAMNREMFQTVKRALAELPPTQRAALELKSFGHPLKAIAEMLEITPSNAGVLVHRGRKALAAHVAPMLAERNEA